MQHTRSTTVFALASLGLMASVVQGQGTWTEVTEFPATQRAGAACFAIGEKGYWATGLSSGFAPLNDLWEYDAIADTWTEKSPVPGQARFFACAFAIGNKGYVGLGRTGGGAYLNDLWEYDPSADSWTQMASFPGASRAAVTVFTIGTKAYVCAGANLSNSTYFTDVFEWDQSTNTWTERAEFPGDGRGWAVGFAIGGKGYVGSGSSGGLFAAPYYNDFWEYDPVGDTWEQKANVSGPARTNAVGFSIGGRGYLGTGAGAGNAVFDDFHSYDPGTNSWATVAAFGGNARSAAGGLAIGNTGYVGVGGNHAAFTYYSDVWAFAHMEVALDDLTETELPHLYPNPVSESLRIAKLSTLLGGRLEIIDVHGRMVLQTRITRDEEVVDASRLVSGTYTCGLFPAGANGARRIRFVVE